MFTARPVAILTTQEPRPDGACLTHLPPDPGWSWQRASPGYRTCTPCYDRLHHWLSLRVTDDDGRPDSIPGLYALLSPRPRHTLTGGEIRRPVAGSRSPANDHVVAMRDGRTTARLRPGDPCSAPSLLRAWVDYVWDERYDDAALEQPDYLDRLREIPGGVTDAAVWLDRQLDWLTRQDAVMDFYDELRQLHSALRNIGQRRVKIGDCPNTIDEGETTRECGAALFVPLHSDIIVCWAPDCRRRWTRDKWLALGNLMDGM